MDHDDAKALSEHYKRQITEKDAVLDRQREQIKMLQQTATRLRDEKAVAEEATRVVLVKPGDILLIGNMGGTMQRIDKIGNVVESFADLCDIRVAVFEADIVIDTMALEELRGIVAARVKGEFND